MKISYASILNKLKKAVDSTGPVTKWSSDVLVFEESEKVSKKLFWWVPSAAGECILTDEEVAFLAEGSVISSDCKPVKKQIGGTRAFAYKVDVEALKRKVQYSANAQSEADMLRARLKALEVEYEGLKNASSRDLMVDELLNLVRNGDKSKRIVTPTKPKVLAPTRISADNIGIPTLFLSDWHYGEVVDETQINGVNGYNLEIAEERADRVAKTALELLLVHQSGMNYDGVCLALGGDMLSGVIHDELRHTNEKSIAECTLMLAKKLANIIVDFAKSFPFVLVPAVVGNHGRMDKKAAFKNAVKDNHEWLLYHLVKSYVEVMLGSNCNVEFRISDSLEIEYSLYGTRYLLVHGDNLQLKGFNNGRFIPSLLDHAVNRRENAYKVMRGSKNTSVAPFDVLMCGHFHTYTTVDGCIVNGSLRGTSEYSYCNNYSHEAPTQAMWITHPSRGIIQHIPVFGDEPKVADRANSPPFTCHSMATVSL